MTYAPDQIPSCRDGFITRLKRSLPVSIWFGQTDIMVLHHSETGYKPVSTLLMNRNVPLFWTPILVDIIYHVLK